jgi:LDH2 family malate/lactate/ureidoglycolate dehydrogenase
MWLRIISSETGPVRWWRATPQAAGVDLATNSGAAVVEFRDASHVGPLGEWGRLAAGEGVDFLGFSNTSGSAKNTAPYGGRERKLSTNTIAFGFPTFDVLPFNVVSDFATGQVSGSTFGLARCWTTSGRRLRRATPLQTR